MRSELKEVKKKIDDEDKARKDATLFVTIYTHILFLIVCFIVQPNHKEIIICFQKQA
jgi:hypothetical protein